MGFGRYFGYFLLDSFQCLLVHICLSSLLTSIEYAKTISLLHESVLHVRVKLIIIFNVVRLSIWLRIFNHHLQILHLLKRLRVSLIKARCLVLFAFFHKTLNKHLVVTLVASLNFFRPLSSAFTGISDLNVTA